MQRFLQRAYTVRDQQGMALLECMMALLIFSVGLLGLLGLEARVMNTSVDSEDRNRAALFAGELASQMWLNHTVAPATPDYIALKASVNDMTKGGVPNGAVAFAPVAGTTNAVDITVTWQETSDTAGNLSTLTTRVILP
ncbi:MAG TPA: prepilin-type N-terminal cleavage/methylation domain-containing protein [Rhodopila sp.]